MKMDFIVYTEKMAGKQIKKTRVAKKRAKDQKNAIGSLWQ